MRYLALLLCTVMAGCSAAVSDRSTIDGASGAPRPLFARMIDAVGHAPLVLVDALLPSPPQAGREPSRPSDLSASANCPTPEQAYQSSLDRRSAELPRYRPASTRDGIEVFGRAIGVIAAARYSAKHAAQDCVTGPQSPIAW